MNITQALAFIHRTSWMGSRLGLERMAELMRRLGDPQRELKFIHVAGTNGKGSACAMLASIMRAAGYRTGMYTSPHLSRVNERFVIDGEEITDEMLCSVAESVKLAADGMAEQPTEFEIITAMAFVYFHVQSCDIVVLEVGLGGRLDATNVIEPPEVAVLMNIGLEHTEILGDTLEKIAAEKAGIIKNGCAVAAYPCSDGVIKVYEELCAERKAMLYVADFAELHEVRADLDGQTFSWKDITDLRLPLAGEHQLHNAAVALKAVELIRARGWNISDGAVRSGLAGTRWPARMEILSREPLFILDGAHNPQCAAALAAGLRELLPEGNIVFLAGVLADKDYPAILSLMLPMASEFICLTPDSERALQAEELADYLTKRGVKASPFTSVEAGVRAALAAAGRDGAVVAFGSLYLAGSIRDAFRAVRAE